MFFFKVLFVVLVLGIIFSFIAFNLEHRTNISLIFLTFENVPIFFSLFIAFAVGVLFTSVLAFFFNKKAKNSRKSQELHNSSDVSAHQNNNTAQ